MLTSTLRCADYKPWPKDVRRDSNSLKIYSCILLSIPVKKIVTYRSYRTPDQWGFKKSSFRTKPWDVIGQNTGLDRCVTIFYKTCVLPFTLYQHDGCTLSEEWKIKLFIFLSEPSSSSPASTALQAALPSSRSESKDFWPILALSTSQY